MTSSVLRDRRARSQLHCTNPTAFIWCLGKIPAGGRYRVALDQATGSLLASLCDECARRWR